MDNKKTREREGEREKRERERAKVKSQQDYYLKELEAYRDRSKNKKEHAVNQFGNLIVGISTAGIGFVTIYLKDIVADLTLARISQISFVVCLFLNLFSHILSSFTNNLSVKIAEDDLKANVYEKYPEGIIEDTFEEYQVARCIKQKRFDFTIKSLNILSITVLMVAVILFMIFATIIPQTSISSLEV